MKTPLLAVLLLAIAPLSSAASYPTFVFITHGPSMMPTLPAKHTPAIAELTPYDKLEAGDIVLTQNWEYGNGLTSHTLMFRDSRGWWITKGDNNPYFDHVPTTPTNYRGRLIESSGKPLGRGAIKKNEEKTK